MTTGLKYFLGPEDYYSLLENVLLLQHLCSKKKGKPTKATLDVCILC